jgi:tripartite-type tricarboxylate transporter receptor subunit TctC
MRLVLAVAAMTQSILWMPAAHADDVADFYRGKAVNLTAGFNPGGGADTYARIIARHLGKHIPGSPTVIVRNMQGAGSVIAANHLYNVSGKDGTEIGLFAGNITIDPLMGGTQHKYDARKFNWIGAPSADSNVCLASPKTTFKTIDDVIAREMITGTSGTSTYDFPVVMNNVLGAKFKLVKGYGGSAALRLALERGEIEGFCGVGYNSMRTAGLLDGRANILVQVGLQKNPHMPDVPFIMDYAKSDQDLRDAFDHAMKDPALLADAQKAQVDIEPMTGKAIASFVDDAYRTPPEVAAKAAQYLGRTAQ